MRWGNFKTLQNCNQKLVWVPMQVNFHKITSWIRNKSFVTSHVLDPINFWSLFPSLPSDMLLESIKIIISGTIFQIPLLCYSDFIFIGMKTQLFVQFNLLTTVSFLINLDVGRYCQRIFYFDKFDLFFHIEWHLYLGLYSSNTDD